MTSSSSEGEFKSRKQSTKVVLKICTIKSCNQSTILTSSKCECACEYDASTSLYIKKPGHLSWHFLYLKSVILLSLVLFKKIQVSNLITCKKLNTN